MASAAAKVGSSRFAAGVPVRDLDRRVDFPNDPVSGTVLRALDTAGLPSLLGEPRKSGRSGNIRDICAVFCTYPGKSIA
jgi:hypothetical protein